MARRSDVRHSYDDSCHLLQRLGYLDEAAIPAIPDRRPQYDDDPPGVSFFRTMVNEGDLTNLTLPRTYFGRCDVGPVSFRNSDLSESTLCWNSFHKTDLTEADLSSADLRASAFSEVTFVRTSLRNADLRQSTFERCDFTEADLRGAKLTRKQDLAMPLSNDQRSTIDWQDSDGDEPPGG